ncbi:MAG: outer membrane protein transport protein [Pseudomonadales bacterium]|nr:outer membrane protein transport protein [Halioglobus sp.]MCP5128771.1 outer membrane protein transport protein [Pseudomonadales bacterium]
MPDNQYSIARKLLPGCGLAFLISHDALAVGFIISPPSQLTGMANAGSAVYDRSTASVNNNPAAMSLMNDMHVGGNLTAVIPDWSVNEGWDCKAENNCSKDPAATSSFIPTLGLVRPLGNDFTWGIGLGAIAGQGMDYGERFKTRPIVTKNELQVAGLMNALSWRMNEQWTFGASAGLIYGSVEQKQDLPSLSASAGEDITSVIDFVGLAQGCEGLPPVAQAVCLGGAVEESGLNPESATETLASLKSYTDGNSGTKVKLEGNDIATAASVGTTYEFHSGHRLGLVYQYMGNFSFDGNATINGELLSDEDHQKQNMSLSWNMPDRLILSGSHPVSSDLSLYWDVERVFFDNFRRTNLHIEGYPVVEIDRNFKDANRYAIGAEYALSERLILQAGLSYDESPVDDSDRMPDIPVDEIVKTAIGTIYQVNQQLSVQGYAIAEFLGDAKIEQLAGIDGHKIGPAVNMDSDVIVYVVGVSFGYKF